MLTGIEANPGDVREFLVPGVRSDVFMTFKRMTVTAIEFSGAELLVANW